MDSDRGRHQTSSSGFQMHVHELTPPPTHRYIYHPHIYHILKHIHTYSRTKQNNTKCRAVILGQKETWETSHLSPRYTGIRSCLHYISLFVPLEGFRQCIICLRGWDCLLQSWPLREENQGQLWKVHFLFYLLLIAKHSTV